MCFLVISYFTFNITFYFPFHINAVQLYQILVYFLIPKVKIRFPMFLRCALLWNNHNQTTGTDSQDYYCYLTAFRYLKHYFSALNISAIISSLNGVLMCDTSILNPKIHLVIMDRSSDVKTHKSTHSSNRSWNHKLKHMESILLFFKDLSST